MKTHTVDTLMALADAYAEVSVGSTTAHAVEMQEALHAALTEALAQPIKPNCSSNIMKTTELEWAKIEAEYKLKLDTYERRFQTQKSMVDSLLVELESANIKNRKLKNESCHLEE